MKRKTCLLLICLMVMAAIGLWSRSALAEKVTLTYWTADFNPDTNVWVEKEFLPQFEKENPGVKVDYLPIPWSEIFAKELVAFASGTAPDLLVGGAAQVYDFATKKMAIPLDEYVAKWGQKDNFFDAVWPAQIYKGRIYRIPTRTDSRIMLYWKDIFEEVGLDPEKAPETWDEMAVAARKTTIREGRKLIRMGLDLWWTSPEQTFHSWVYQNGGEVIAPDFSKSLFNSPEGLEALQWLVDVYNDIQPVGTAGLMPGIIPHFAAKKQAMHKAVTAVMYQLKQYVPKEIDKVGFFVPRKKVPICQVFANAVIITTQSKHPDEAWKFIEFLTNKENMRVYSRAINGLNPRKDGAEDPWIREELPGLLNWYDATLRFGRARCLYPEVGKLNKQTNDQVELALKKEKTPEQALKDLAAIWDETLKKAKAERPD